LSCHNWDLKSAAKVAEYGYNSIGVWKNAMFNRQSSIVSRQTAETHDSGLASHDRLLAIDIRNNANFAALYDKVETQRTACYPDNQ
jgi:hypothetical protein